VCLNRVLASGMSSFVSQNYLEIGGDDVAALKAYGNMVANVPGIVLPPIGVLVRSRSNSLRGFWVIVASFHVFCGVVCSSFLSMKTAAELFREKFGRDPE